MFLLAGAGLQLCVHRYFGFSLLETSLKPWNPVNDDVCNRRGELVLQKNMSNQVSPFEPQILQGLKNLKI